MDEFKENYRNPKIRKKKVTLDVDFEMQRKEDGQKAENNKFHPDDFELWNHATYGVFVPVFTDRSFSEEKSCRDSCAGAAVFWKEESKHNWADVPKGKQTSFNAELYAYETALAKAPIDENGIIFTDCITAANNAEKEMTYNERYKSANGACIERIKTLLKLRQAKNVKTNFVWVPSHSLEVEVSERKKNQLEFLKNEFPDYNLVKYNDIVDKMAKETRWQRQTRMIGTQPTRFRCLKAPPDQKMILKGTPQVVLLDEEIPFEGNIRKMIKSILKDRHRDQKFKNSKYPNHSSFVPAITGFLLKSDNPTDKNLVKNLLQFNNFLSITPHRIWKTCCYYTGFTNRNIFNKLTHSSPLCEDEKCDKQTCADLIHILSHPPAEETKKILAKHVGAVLRKEKVKIEKDITTYWTNEQTPDTKLNFDNQTQLKMTEEENYIVTELKYTTEENILKRRKMENAWNDETNFNRRFESKDQSLKIRTMMGYFPKELYEEIRKQKSVAQSNEIAAKILRIQIEGWIKIKNEFWKSRWEQIKQNVDLKKMKRQRHSGKDP